MSNRRGTPCLTCLKNGVNPSFLHRKSGAKVLLETGTDHDLEDGDVICVLMEDYKYRIHIQTQSTAAPASSSAAAAAAIDSDDEPAAAPAAKKKKRDSDDEGDGSDADDKPPAKLAKQSSAVAAAAAAGLPVCKYGPSCFRKNPQHFLEFAHPWAMQDES